MMGMHRFFCIGTVVLLMLTLTACLDENNSQADLSQPISTSSSSGEVQEPPKEPTGDLDALPPEEASSEVSQSSMCTLPPAKPPAPNALGGRWYIEYPDSFGNREIFSIVPPSLGGQAEAERCMEKLSALQLEDIVELSVVAENSQQNGKWLLTETEARILLNSISTVILTPAESDEEKPIEEPNGVALMVRTQDDLIIIDSPSNGTLKIYIRSLGNAYVLKGDIHLNAFVYDNHDTRQNLQPSRLNVDAFLLCPTPEFYSKDIPPAHRLGTQSDLDQLSQYIQALNVRNVEKMIFSTPEKDRRGLWRISDEDVCRVVAGLKSAKIRLVGEENAPKEPFEQAVYIGGRNGLPTMRLAVSGNWIAVQPLHAEEGYLLADNGHFAQLLKSITALEPEDPPAASSTTKIMAAYMEYPDSFGSAFISQLGTAAHSGSDAELQQYRALLQQLTAEGVTELFVSGIVSNPMPVGRWSLTAEETEGILNMLQNLQLSTYIPDVEDPVVGMQLMVSTEEGYILVIQQMGEGVLSIYSSQLGGICVFGGDLELELDFAAILGRQNLLPDRLRVAAYLLNPIPNSYQTLYGTHSTVIAGSMEQFAQYQGFLQSLTATDLEELLLSSEQLGQNGIWRITEQELKGTLTELQNLKVTLLQPDEVPEPIHGQTLYLITMQNGVRLVLTITEGDGVIGFKFGEGELHLYRCDTPILENLLNDLI